MVLFVLVVIYLISGIKLLKFLGNLLMDISMISILILVSNILMVHLLKTSLPRLLIAPSTSHYLTLFIKISVRTTILIKDPQFFNLMSFRIVCLFVKWIQLTFFVEQESLD